jgi:hypothetical protein
MRGPNDFKRTNVKRAFVAANDAGIDVDRVEVAPDGTIKIFPVRAENKGSHPASEWDQDLAKPAVPVRS